MKTVDELVADNLRLVHSIAKKYSSFGIEYEDLVGEGMEGLVISAQRFNQQAGVQFSTYAYYWIRHRIYRYLHNNANGHVHIPRRSDSKPDRMRFRLPHVVAKLKAAGLETTHEMIGRVMDMTPDEVEACIRRRGRIDARLDKIVSYTGSEGGNTKTLGDFVLVDDRTPEDECTRGSDSREGAILIDKFLGRLSPRSRQVVVMRHLSDPRQSFAEIAVHFGMSRQRIQQIEIVAMRKMRKLAGTSSFKEMACDRKRSVNPIRRTA